MYCLGVRASNAANDDIEFFERRVRSILIQRCQKCHGERKQESSLRLDSRAGILAGGASGNVVSVGKPEASRLVSAIRRSGDLQMPPDKPLSAEEVAALVEWVERGVPWPDDASGGTKIEPFDLEKRKREHWAWHPIADPPVPEVANEDWPLDPLDQFILAKLEDGGIEPAADADRRTWLRRVTFDLTGLPPTPDEIDSFLVDNSAQAFDSVVDRLLASPHFGERWARHWMDLVRYAETYGHEFDYPIPSAWRYRDYLIRAFNVDVPYDRFVIEHIAGDLVPNPRRHPQQGYSESLIGTAFWWLGEATHAPTDARGDEATRIENQIDVFSKTFLGLTVACARCHDHKFDAISTKDFYALAGFLQSSRRQVAVLDKHGAMAKARDEIEESQVQLNRQLAGDLTEDFLLGEALSLAQYLQVAAQLGPRPAKPKKSDAADDVPAAVVEFDRKLRDRARSRQLDAKVLRRWNDAFYEDRARRADHPLFIARILADEFHDLATATAAEQTTARAYEKLLNHSRRRLDEAQHTWQQYAQESTPFADSQDDSFDQWLSSGPAFGKTPAQSIHWTVEHERLRRQRWGTAHSGRLHRKLTGSISSPVFTIEHETIHYRLRGKNAKVRLVVDGYFMEQYSSLLFAGTSFDVNESDEFAWRVQAGDVRRFLGHRAHIELVDAGDGFVEVDEVRFSHRRGNPPSQPLSIHETVLDLLEENDSEWSTDVAQAILQTAAKSLRHGASDDAVDLLNWLIQRDLLESLRTSDSITEQLNAYRDTASAATREIPKYTSVVAMADSAAENDKVHIRGSHLNLGDVVVRRFLESMGGDEPASDERGSGRLLLARRVASSENPLTARVLVNRVWHHLTGRGIVATVDNFGAMGRPPTHPQLLDRLARDFINDGWSIKQLIRRIVQSRTYRMSSKPTESGLTQDPANLLLRSMRIRRLQGEAIRDAILAMSGRLDRNLYGPSVPIHLTPFMTGRGRPGKSGPLDGNSRRSIYITVRRNFLSPMMLAFNTPIPFTTVGRRNISNVPAQALILLNDPFLAGEAKLWAESLVLEDISCEERIRRMYVAALGRPPSDTERLAALRFFKRQANEIGVDPSAAERDVRLWADLAHVLLNTKEFILLY